MLLIKRGGDDMLKYKVKKRVAATTTNACNNCGGK